MGGGESAAGGPIDRRARLWPWQRWYFLRHGALSPDADTVDPARLLAQAVICTCAGVTRGTLSAAVAAGHASVADLLLQTAAGECCGTCRPALARLVGAPAAEETATAPGGGFLLLSLLAALLPWLALVLPGVPVSASLLHPEPLPNLLAAPLVRQLTGYTGAALLLLGLGLSLNKRLKLPRFFSFNRWRILHLALVAAVGAVLLVHTNFGLGERFNAQLMALFLAATLTGLALSIAVVLEQGFFGPIARRWRGPLLTLHLLSMTLLFVYVPLHALASYYY